MSKINATTTNDLIGNEVAESVPATSASSPIRDFLTGPYPTLVSRLLLGGIFFIAGLTKLNVPETMRQSILAYEIPLPSFLVSIMSVGLPILEVGLGIWLLIGLFVRLSAVISTGLMVIFTLAITQAWLRGLNIDCGCFGGAETNAMGLALVNALGPIGTYLATEKAGPETIIRDIIFILMGVHLFFVPTIFALDNLRSRHNTVEEEVEE
ncbi:MAG: MauE/DoxX family redox-associated membrane protein [Chloroflexota bacterium]